MASTLPVPFIRHQPRQRGRFLLSAIGHILKFAIGRDQSFESELDRLERKIRALEFGVKIDRARSRSQIHESGSGERTPWAYGV